MNDPRFTGKTITIDEYKTLVYNEKTKKLEFNKEHLNDDDYNFDPFGRELNENHKNKKENKNG